jgi:hypothetical protein
MLVEYSIPKLLYGIIPPQHGRACFQHVLCASTWFLMRYVRYLTFQSGLPRQRQVYALTSGVNMNLGCCKWNSKVARSLTQLTQKIAPTTTSLHRDGLLQADYPRSRHVQRSVEATTGARENSVCME